MFCLPIELTFINIITRNYSNYYLFLATTTGRLRWSIEVESACDIKLANFFFMLQTFFEEMSVKICLNYIAFAVGT